MHFFMRSVLYGSLITTSLAFGLTNIEEKNLINDLHITLEQTATWVQELNEHGILQQPQDITRLTPDNTMIPLYRAYPALNAIPHITLCVLPTPIHQLENLSAATHCPLYVKRDDMSGGDIYGGNKPRKLEFLLADALTRGAQHVITFGCAGSNHALATSIHAKRHGMQPLCVLLPQSDSQIVQENLCAHLANGTELHYAQGRAGRLLLTTALWLDLYHRTGTFPYLIPVGGSNALGTLGFVNAAFELKEQVAAGIMPKPTHIYVPCGSMATATGLALGCKLAGLSSRIVAVVVEPENEPGSFEQGIIRFLDQTIALLQKYDANIPTMSYTDLAIDIRHGFGGPGYGIATQEALEAKEIFATQENITLEGTYTGKAAAALLHDIEEGIVTDSDVILFWLTYCPAPQIKEAPKDYMRLPKAFHQYFEAIT